MFPLPPFVAARYRPATEREVHSRSFGHVQAPRNASATGWEQLRGTLDDEAVFGPLLDLECACGKYRGAKLQNMICDRCGVKVTTRSVRRHRFGHIDLPVSIVHPVAQGGERLGAIPVLPAAYMDSHAGKGLADLYDELVRSALPESAEGMARNFERLVELLVPLVIVAHEWDLLEAPLLAFGLALTSHASEAAGTYCDCGFPLDGLEVLLCPGVRNEIEIAGRSALLGKRDREKKRRENGTF
jgi:hypothetical protein